MSLRFVALVAVGAAAALFVLSGHSGQSIPGRTIAPPPSAASAPAITAGPVTTSTPEPAPSQGHALDGLRGPVSALFGELNRDTAATATGEFSILRDISTTLRSWIEHLLQREGVAP